MFFGVALIIGGWGVAGWGRKSEIVSFSSQYLSRRNKHDSFWLVVSTGYFYVLFLWAIIVSDFLPLEIYKHLLLSLSSITFTANSEAVYHFYNYVYLFQILYSMKWVFLLKDTFRYFIFRFDLKMWNTAFIFSNRSRGTQKKLFIEENSFFSVNCVKINELHVVHRWRHMQCEWMKWRR